MRCEVQIARFWLPRAYGRISKAVSTGVENEPRTLESIGRISKPISCEMKCTIETLGLTKIAIIRTKPNFPSPNKPCSLTLDCSNLLFPRWFEKTGFNCSCVSVEKVTLVTFSFHGVVVYLPGEIKLKTS